MSRDICYRASVCFGLRPQEFLNLVICICAASSPPSFSVILIFMTFSCDLRLIVLCRDRKSEQLCFEIVSLERFRNSNGDAAKWHHTATDKRSELKCCTMNRRASDLLHICVTCDIVWLQERRSRKGGDGISIYLCRGGAQRAHSNSMSLA